MGAHQLVEYLGPLGPQPRRSRVDHRYAFRGEAGLPAGVPVVGLGVEVPFPGVDLPDEADVVPPGVGDPDQPPVVGTSDPDVPPRRGQPATEDEAAAHASAVERTPSVTSSSTLRASAV